MGVAWAYPLSHTVTWQAVYSWKNWIVSWPLPVSDYTGMEWAWEIPCDGHDYLVCRLGMGYVTQGTLRGNHLAYRLGMGSWHVGCA